MAPPSTSLASLPLPTPMSEPLYLPATLPLPSSPKYERPFGGVGGGVMLLQLLCENQEGVTHNAVSRVQIENLLLEKS